MKKSRTRRTRTGDSIVPILFYTAPPPDAGPLLRDRAALRAEQERVLHEVARSHQDLADRGS